MEIKFKVENLPPTSPMVELLLWPPPQGTEWSCIPLQVDLQFHFETISLSKDLSVDVYAKSAVVQVRHTNMEICRGSKYGGDLREPYVVAEAQEAISQLVETECIAEFSGGFELAPSWYSKFAAFWRRTRRRKKETDYVLRASLRVSRVAPTTDDRWQVVEPTGNGILNGKYLGMADLSVPERADPLCLLSLSKDHAEVYVAVFVQRDKLFFNFNGFNCGRVSRNVNAVLSELARRDLKPESRTKVPVSFRPGPNAILFGISRLEATREV